MGADWLKFKIRKDANLKEVRQLAAFLNEHPFHSHSVVTPPPTWDEAIAARWKKTHQELQNLLEFPRDREQAGYWDFTMLTDPPGVQLGRPPGMPPQVGELEICRVYVLSHNPLFPVEWREEAYRIILPTELPAYISKWRTYIEQVLAGQWPSYLHALYLYDRVHDVHQHQEFANLLRWAEESQTRRSAWCRKEQLVSVRELILQFNALAQLQAMRAAIPWPKFDEAKPGKKISKQQQAQEEEYWKLFGRAAEQIREWNRFVPQNRKAQFPNKLTYDNYLGHASSSWLRNFFAWCRHLADQKYGLFLWA